METDTPHAADAPAAKPAKAMKPVKKESWWETVKFVLTVFLGALIIRTFIVAPFSIPSGSMVPRLLIGDYLFVSKWSYGYSRYSLPFGLGSFDGRFFGGVPERGDVVVFRYPGSNDDWVKRVIGLPGDTVEVRDGQVILNGQPVQRHRIADLQVPISPNSPCDRARGDRIAPAQADNGTDCAYPRFRETLPGGRSYDVLDQISNAGPDNFAAVRVPEGHLFVMGDNRDNSADSRVALEDEGVGMLPIDNVLGRVLVTFFSTDGSASWIKPWTWFSAARWDRIGQTD